MTDAKPLSREFLLAQGKCCHNECQNCPYMNKNEYSKEFNEWAICYFSWEENPDPKEIESHWMAWNACKLRILKTIAEQSTIPSVVPVPEFYPLESIINRIKKL
jgi:hypothetical protein